MLEPKDFYFSTPVPFPFNSEVSIVLITAKEIYDQERRADYQGPEYRVLAEELLLPEGLVETMENVFESEEAMSCDDLKFMLEQRGFIHNPELDDLLDRRL